MKTIGKIKRTIKVASLLFAGGVLAILFSGFVSDTLSSENDPVKKESSAKKKEVKTWRWEEMYPSDMREALEEMPVAWVVFSPLEWHGEAMTFGTDPVIGQHVLDKVWKRVGGVRIPTVYIGSETEFKYLDKGIKSHWGLEVVTKEHNYGSIYTRTVTLQLVLEDYLYFLKREGFKLVIVNSGHGGSEHVKMMREVCERFSDESFKAVFGFYGMADRVKIPEELSFPTSGGHADIQEFSILGAVNPDMVDIEKFGVTEQDRKTGLKHENRDNIDIEKAKKAIAFFVDSSVEKVQDMVDEMKKADQKPEKWNGWSYHEMETDANGILPWYDPAHLGRSYDHVLDLVWNYWINLPTMPNGYKYYVQFRIANAPDNHKGAQEGGLGGDQIGMAMSSWRLYYAYNGNPELIADMKYMADTYLELGLSPANYSWPNVTYPCNINAGIEPGEAATSGTIPLIYNGDTRDGVGITQPDKAGSFAYELVMLYEMTGEIKYLEAAKKMAATLASKVKPGDIENSPLPFKVNARTGKVVAPYTSNWVSTVKLFEELSRLGEGSYSDEAATIKEFLKNTVIPNHKYGPFFEDIIGYSETSINAVTLATYILEEGPAWGPDWQADAKNILTFCKDSFSVETNRRGVEYYSLYQVIPIAEQTAYMVEGNSHTSRYASVVLLYGEKTGDTSDEAMAIKQLSWATYMVKSDGQNVYPYDGVWLTDGYGDYVRHYLRAMGANPELAPDNGNHLLKSTSVVSDITYSDESIEYTTFDAISSEVFRLVSKPRSISACGNKLNPDEYRWEKLDKGGILRLSSDKGSKRVIQYK